MQLLDHDELDNGKLNYISVKDPIDLGFKVAQGLMPGGTVDGVKQASKIDIEFIKHKPYYPIDLDGELAPFDVENGIHAEMHPKKLLIRTPKRY